MGIIKNEPPTVKADILESHMAAGQNSPFLVCLVSLCVVLHELRLLFYIMNQEAVLGILH